MERLTLITNVRAAERLKSIEDKWQAEWSRAKVYEANVNPSKPKFFVTFPFPYMNGLPHLGSAFTILRVDITARYKRMRGYNVLFPQGWHATGGPIVAAARRLSEGDAKILNELKSMGVSESMIPQFKDPATWVRYFTQEWKKDLMRYGLSIDWRREFFTTSLNPYFSKFVEWQYLKLRDLGYIRKGEHPVVWCPHEKKVVGDHDRPDEYVGIGPVEATIVLFKQVDGDAYLATLTYRPETIFGVTNLWVNPASEYALAEVDGRRVILNEYMAEELADQRHEVKIIGRVSARELIGVKVIVPLTNAVVPVLPATFVVPDEGTGLVMSVPAHAPYDYVALMDLKKMNEDALREYGIDPSEVRSIRVKKIIETPGLKGIPAESIVSKLGAKSQEDRDLLEKATKDLYSREYYMGVMKGEVGSYEGLKVIEARPAIESELVKLGHAIKVYTLPSKVYCRCGARTHVKFVENQWFLTYSDEGWKLRTKKLLSNMNIYPPHLKSDFMQLVDWLKDWACTHQNELGTPLPWDKDWVIESLSDSTIYMAYYTIDYLLQGKVNPEQLKPEFFDYVFLGKGSAEEVSKSTGLPLELIEAARREFTYWYPVDLRISGKDLMQNHLLFFMYHHAAIFDESLWPRGIGINGWVLINGAKMSKSTGNFITLRQMLNEAGADATRIAEVLAGADGGLDDANFTLRDVDTALSDLVDWLDFVKDNYGKGRDERLAIDDWFESTLNSTVKRVTESMEQLKFKTAFTLAFYELQNKFRWYLKRAGTPNRDLLKKYIEYVTLMLAPFAPHTAEEAWHVTGHTTFVVTEKWPEYDERLIRDDVETAERIVEVLLNDIRDIVGLLGAAKSVTVTVATEWKYAVLSDLKRAVDAGKPLKEAVKDVMGKDYGVPRQELSKVLQSVLRSPEVLELLVSRDVELKALAEARDFLSRELGGIEIRIEKEEEGTSPRKSNALPGKPAIYVSK
ncbi:leucine--tRNA ligase [Acidilobus saccharovorans]|uniref:leucine--tRNA ligase n=1 Tax=Acidilobus saccharovorans TaxID=242703 RepID=UPI003B832AD6